MLNESALWLVKKELHTMHLLMDIVKRNTEVESMGPLKTIITFGSNNA